MGSATLGSPLVERTLPSATARGTVIVLPGRGDDPSYYRRLSNRLAVDGYATAVATAPLASVDDVVSLWAAESGETAGVVVVIGVDTSAGLLASALAAAALDPLPAGAVFAGIAAPGAPAHVADELAARSACPVHRGVVEAADAPALAASEVAAVWPTGTAAVPVLAIHGAADALSPLAAVRPLLDGWDAEVVTVTGGLHDVLNDVHHRSVAAEIVQFVEGLRVGASVLTRESTR